MLTRRYLTSFYLSCLFLGPFFFAHPLHADESLQVRFEENPWISTRAMGMAEAISPLASGIDAAYYNPAGIGGLTPQNKNAWARQLLFPYVGTSMNAHALNLGQDWGAKGGIQSGTLGDAVLKSHAGKRQSARISGLFDLTLQRIELLEFWDYQILMLEQANSDPEKSLLIRTRSRSGPGLGFSVTNAAENFYLGLFSSYVTQNELDEQTNFSKIANIDTRNKFLSEHVQSKTTLKHNLGLRWTFGKKSEWALSLVGRGFQLNSSTSSAKSLGLRTPTEEDLTSKDLDALILGTSYSLQLKSFLTLQTVLETKNLSSDLVSIPDKIRLGSELNFAGTGLLGERALLSLRTGLNTTGISFGLGLHLGLLGLEFASYIQDIGMEGRPVVDRRQALVFYVDAAQ
ncbi:MAG: hypothetical protein KA436_04135 [Oligoflexales bacterium]|nr:hypothetical protein [Oligoflexales bacterium]